MMRNRIEYISLLSVISAVAVVFLHTNGCFHTFSTGRYWFSANIIDSVFYFAVPIFFMISGAMLIDFDERYGMRTFFSKRFHKTFIPFIVWSFIGLAFQIYYLKSVNEADVNLTYVVNGLLNCNLTNVYWFFAPLFCTYLVIPLFSLIPKDKNRNIFIYLVSLGFILNILAPFIISVLGLKIDLGISLAASGGYLFYTLTGYLLHKFDIERKYRLMLYAAALIGLAVMITGTYVLSMDAGEIVDTYRGYVNLPCVLYSIGVFVFVKYDLVKLMKFDLFGRIIDFLNPYTFGIYLIHWYVLMIILKVSGIANTSILFRLLAPFLIIPVCVAAIWILRKVPVIRNIVP